MNLIQRKVCLLGARAVGKTSLVRRFVESMFSERYQATIGVKIDRKLVTLSPRGDDARPAAGSGAVEVGGTQVSLLIWDLQGEDELHRIRTSYLRGAAGLMIVADGTAPQTLETAATVLGTAVETIGSVPAVLLLNKCDLTDNWRVDEHSLPGKTWADMPVLRTSARSGERVDDAFGLLAERMAGG